MCKNNATKCHEFQVSSHTEELHCLVCSFCSSQLSVHVDYSDFKGVSDVLRNIVLFQNFLDQVYCYDGGKLISRSVYMCAYSNIFRF